MTKLVSYANEHGEPEGRPYYSINGKKPVTEEEWSEVRYSWTHQHGFSNVWQRPALRDSERIRGTGLRQAPRVHNPTAGMASAHLNQKPLEFMRRILIASRWRHRMGTIRRALLGERCRHRTRSYSLRSRD